MKIVKEEVKDLPLVVDMKMRMFREVGTVDLLRDNAEALKCEWGEER